MDKAELDDFIQRYVAMWHEADPSARRRAVASLFAENAENYTGKSVSRGVDEICARVQRAHDEWVEKRSFVFVPTDNLDEHHNVIKFFWQMVPASGGPTESVGLDIFVLDGDDKIRVLYQFIEPNRGSRVP